MVPVFTQTAEHPAALDDGDRLAELCRSDGGLARRDLNR